jgi:predicted DCC family thiol-disulfide oxidoreductase YuxK
MGVFAMASRDPLTVLYDSECGFCARCAMALRRLDRGGRLRMLPLRAGTTIPDAPSEHDLLAAMHVVDAAGRWDRGGAAWLRIAAVVPLLRPLAVAGRLPMVGAGVERLYQLVARNRHRLSRMLGLDMCTVADARP